MVPDPFFFHDISGKEILLNHCLGCTPARTPPRPPPPPHSGTKPDRAGGPRWGQHGEKTGPATSQPGSHYAIDPPVKVTKRLCWGLIAMRALVLCPGSPSGVMWGPSEVCWSCPVGRGGWHVPRGVPVAREPAPPALCPVPWHSRADSQRPPRTCGPAPGASPPSSYVVNGGDGELQNLPLWLQGNPQLTLPVARLSPPLGP